MLHDSIPLLINNAVNQGGTFTGLASVFDNDGDIVRRGAFSKSLGSGTSIPLIWMHKADDPRCYVGDVVEAAETETHRRSRAGLISILSPARRPTETPRAAECQV
jgi:hypothetical protein